MVKKILMIVMLLVSVALSQQVTDIAFPISGNTGKTDSVQIPAGMIPVGVWSSTLIAGTLVGFNMSVDGGATFLGLGETGVDTVAFTVPLDKNAGLIIPLPETTFYLLRGTYPNEDDTLWLQLTSSAAQTAVTTILNVRFTTYTGRNQ